MNYRSLIAALAVTCLFALAPTTTNALERTFAVVPQHGSISAVNQWQPLLNELHRQTGIEFRFVTAPSVTEFERRLINGDYDYAYMNAALFLEARAKNGYVGLAQRKRALSGIIVVRTDGPRQLGELRDKIIAFPSPRALGATILTSAELKQKNIPHGAAYLGTHESVYRAVARGQFVGGGGVKRSFQLLPAELRNQLRILHTTKASAPHVIAASNRISKKEAKQVSEVLRAMQHHREGKEALAKLYFDQLGPIDEKGLSRLSALSIPKRRQTRSLVFHVIPRLDQKSTQAQMQPLATYLMQRLEVQIDLATHANMGAFERAIYSEKQPALINANPLQAVHLANRGYRIIAQQVPVNSPEGMRGLILVREDSDIHKLSQLKGKKIAFGGNKNAFFASVVPRQLLEQAGLAGKYHDASQPGPVSDVIRRLREGKVDAAGTGTMALHSTVLKKKYGIDRMRILAQSKAMPGLAWLLSPEVEPALAAEIRDLLLNYNNDAPGHTALQAGGISGLRSATLADYKVVGKYVDVINSR